MGPADLQRHDENLIGGDISGGVMSPGQLLTRPVARLVPWTKPEDHEYRPLDLSSPDPSPLPDFGARHGDGYHGLFGDGQTRFLRRMIADRDLVGSRP